MKKAVITVLAAVFCAAAALAQEPVQAQAQEPGSAPKVITLDQAIQIALSENTAVKVADLEIERSGYARKGSYASLFPQINGSGSYQRTIKKQVMYMDFNIGGATSGSSSGADSGSDSGDGSGSGSGGSSSNNGIEVGRWNTWSTGISASLPLINAQLWQSLAISDQDVELAVEKARSSRIETVTQVKKAYYTVLLAKEALEVYKSVYDNAADNLDLTQKKFNAQRASELDLVRAKTNLANAVPSVYEAANAVDLGLWQLKAVMGVDLYTDIDVAGTIDDYSGELLSALPEPGSLEGNSSLRQLTIQAAQLANSVKMYQFANIPTLSLAFNYSINAMANDYVFSNYRWSPYSYVGLSLNIPIFSGGKRYHDIKAAKVQAAELDLQRANTERQLQIAMRQYIGTMGTAASTYASAVSAEESATKAYSIARESYNVGRSTLTDLSDAQLALTRARLGVCQAVFNYVSAKSDLEGIIGADFTQNNQSTNE